MADWTDTYTAAAAFHPELRAYVRESQDAVGLLPAGERITAAMPTILYRILSLEPFVSWQREPDRDNRLSKLTRVFEAYCSLVGRPLFVGRTGAGQVSQGWLRKFYYLLLGYLDATGMDDDDLEDEICPPGRFPVMTVHQAKGLQFPFVFVGYLGFTSSPSPVHQLEDAVRPFRASAPRYEFTQVERALHDDVRMLYVAYSRAQYALILLAERGQLKGQNKPAVGGAGFAWFNQLVPRL